LIAGAKNFYSDPEYSCKKSMAAMAGAFAATDAAFAAPGLP